MSRIEPKSLDQLGALSAMLQKGAETMGFMPIDGLVMAHCPEMLKGSGALINSVLGSGTIDPGLKRMIGFITSQAAGCHYCSAHTSFTAAKNGIDEEKMKAIWDYQTSDLFTPKERAALDFAQKAGMVPNACTDNDFEILKDHFTTTEVVEIVFTISMYAFLNKFNDTLKTDIESEPLAVYQKIKKES